MRWGRGTVSGLWCGAGAFVAHRMAGGGGEPLVALAILPVAVALCVVLVRRRADPAGIAAVALASQLGLHAVLMAGGSAEATAVLPMLVGHVVVAAVTTVAATGADRLLLSLTRELIGQVLAPVPEARVPVASRSQVPVLTAVAAPISVTLRGPTSPRAPPASPSR